MADVVHWTARPRPERKILEGRYIRLEPLSAVKHGDDLFEAATDGDSDTRFLWLSETTPKSRAAFQSWLEHAESSQDPLFFSCVDVETGKAVGRQSLLRIDPNHGVIEIGHIHWGPRMQRKPAATEAHYLMMKYAFDELGYRRWEWKCNDENAPSKRAALRFGFSHEGVFRQHMVVKDKSRDTAWYSIIDTEWPLLKRAYEGWLSPDNFDKNGLQKCRLEEFRGVV